MLTTFGSGPSDVHPGYQSSNDMSGEIFTDTDAAHNILVMEIIQLISNLEVARLRVVGPVSALKA